MRLVLCAHGTRSPAGRTAVSALVADVARRAPFPVAEAYLDVHGPALGSVLKHGDVVVPLLLSRGHHTEVDIARAAQSFRQVRVSSPLGPSTALVSLLQRRVVQAGFRPGDGVVLAGAGSTRPEADTALRAVADDLSCVLRTPVHPAYVSASDGSSVPAVTEVVGALRRTLPRVLVVPYLLAPGSFLERLRQCDAHVVARPLLQSAAVDPLMTELVLRRAGSVAPATV